MDTTQPKPERYGQRWTKEEEAKLLMELMTTKRVEEIAREFHRSHSGIVARQVKLASQLMNEENKSLAEAAVLVRMSPEVLTANLNRREEKKLNRGRSQTIHDILEEVRDILRVLMEKY